MEILVWYGGSAWEQDYAFNPNRLRQLQKKMKASCSGIYRFTFIFVLASFIDPSLGSKSCDQYYKFGMYTCPVSRKIYPIYSELEDIVTNDSEILFLMRQAFFPGLVPHVLEAEKDEFVLIRVCAIYNETIPPPVCQGVDINSTLTETRCWNYRWSSSPALNMVDVGQLVAFDPVATSLIYSRFVDRPSNRRFLLMFNLSLEDFSCSPAADNLIGAIVLLSTWVSILATCIHISTVHLLINIVTSCRGPEKIMAEIQGLSDLICKVQLQ